LGGNNNGRQGIFQKKLFKGRVLTALGVVGSTFLGGCGNGRKRLAKGEGEQGSGAVAAEPDVFEGRRLRLRTAK